MKVGAKAAHRGRGVAKQLEQQRLFVERTGVVKAISALARLWREIQEKGDAIFSVAIELLQLPHGLEPPGDLDVAVIDRRAEFERALGIGLARFAGTDEGADLGVIK